MLHRRNKVSLRCLGLIVAGLVFGQTGNAQTAYVSGRITDATGAVIPQATVSIINTATGFVRRTHSNNLGYYVIPLLASGQYRMLVQKEGFRPINRRGIKLEVDRKVGIDFILDVGTIAEEVQIVGDVALLNTSDAAQGQVIGNQRIIDMPLNGRDYNQLALLSAGVLQPIGGRFGGFSAAGQKTTQNNFLLDGLDNNSVELAGAGRRSEMVKPSIEAVREFKIQTSSYGAEYGRAMGGVINVVTKSGTNDFHGSVFWFLRNETLDAKNYFDPADKEKPPFKRNQFGFAAGGPVTRDKTFFFGNYEGTRIRESQTSTSTIPMDAMRRGDFSMLSAALTDPASGKPFPGNVIPPSRLDPLATELAQLYPTPQKDKPAANYLHQSPDKEDWEKATGRVDHNLTDKDAIFYRLSFHDRIFPAALHLPAPAFGGGFDGTVRGWNMGVHLSHVFSASTIVQVRAAWNYARFTRSNPAAAGETSLNARYGIPGVDTTQPGGFASFNISGHRVLGLGPFNGVDRDSQNRQVAGDLTVTRGSHTIKTGANILRSQNNIFNIVKEAGVFRFSGKFTGDSMADFLLGQTASFDWSKRLQTDLRGWLAAFYVQDEWKLTPKLALNLGARYEAVLPWQDKYDRMGLFDLNSDPARPRLLLAGTPDAGTGRVRRSLVATDGNNIMPRAGLAYRLGSNTVLRAGYGMYYGYLEPSGDAQFLIGNPPFSWAVTQTSSSTEPAFHLAGGPPPGSTSLEHATGLTFSSMQRHPSREYSQQWTFNIQHQWGNKWLLEAGYTGARSSHLLMRYDGNYSPPAPGNLNLKRPYLSTEITGTGFQASPLGPVVYHDFRGSLSYNALVTKLEKRFSSGFTLLASYTFSKTMGDTCGFSASGNTPGCGYQDPRDFRQEWSRDNQDIPHRLVASGIWEFPFGVGRRWGNSANGVVHALISDWALGSIVTFSSGKPFNLSVPGNPANTGTTAIVNRPDVAGDAYSGARTIEQDFNVDAFVPNTPYHTGNLGRNTLRQRGIFGWDFIALKDIPISERIGCQFRFEAFQLTNTPRFGIPGNQVGTANFGRITSAGTPRNLQFGLKLVF